MSHWLASCNTTLALTEWRHVRSTASQLTRGGTAVVAQGDLHLITSFGAYEDDIARPLERSGRLDAPTGADGGRNFARVLWERGFSNGWGYGRSVHAGHTPPNYARCLEACVCLDASSSTSSFADRTTGAPAARLGPPGAESTGNATTGAAGAATGGGGGNAAAASSPARDGTHGSRGGSGTCATRPSCMLTIAQSLPLYTSELVRYHVRGRVPLDAKGVPGLSKQLDCGATLPCGSNWTLSGGKWKPQTALAMALTKFHVTRRNPHGEVTMVPLAPAPIVDVADDVKCYCARHSLAAWAGGPSFAAARFVLMSARGGPGPRAFVAKELRGQINMSSLHAFDRCAVGASLRDGTRAVWPPGCAPPAHGGRLVPMRVCVPRAFLFSRHPDDAEVEACAHDSRASRAALKAAVAGGVVPITPHELCRAAPGGEAAVRNARLQGRARE